MKKCVEKYLERRREKMSVKEKSWKRKKIEKKGGRKCANYKGTFM